MTRSELKAVRDDADHGISPSIRTTYDLLYHIEGIHTALRDYVGESTAVNVKLIERSTFLTQKTEVGHMIGMYVVQTADTATADKWVTVYEEGKNGDYFKPMQSRNKYALETRFTRHLVFDSDPGAWYRMVWMEPDGAYGVIHDPVSIKRQVYRQKLPSRTTMFLKC